MLLLASLEEKSTYGELDCFLEVEDRDGLNGDNLVDEPAKDEFVLFWEVTALPAEMSDIWSLGTNLFI